MNVTERIILSVEIVENGIDARFSLRVPYDDKMICFGPWLDQAIDELRAECKSEIKSRKANQ